MDHNAWTIRLIENLYFEFNILIYCRLQSVTHCQLT